MRTIFALLALSTYVLAAETEPAPQPSTTPPLQPTAPAAAPSPELAPAGIFYVVSPIRIDTDTGVVSLKPGTGVKLTKPGVYLTPWGEHPLPEAQLTNDLVKARAAAQGEADAQAAVKARIIAIGEQKAQMDTAAATSTTKPPTKAEAKAARRAENADKIEDLKKQSELNQLEIARLTAERKDLANKSTSPRALAIDNRIKALRESQRLIQVEIVKLR